MKKNPNTKRKIPAWLRWIGWALLLQLLLINISAALYAYKLTHFYQGSSLRQQWSSANIFSKTWRLFTGPKQAKSFSSQQPVFPFDAVQLSTEKGLRIGAWYSAADSNAKGTVVLFHGISGTMSQVLDEAYEFRYWGYNVMLVELRAHGNSDGSTTTIGYREAEEVKLAYDFIRQKGEDKLFLFGISLGAVIISRAVAEYELSPSGIILEMPFLSMQSYLKGKARTLGFPQQPFAFLTTFWIGVERGFNGFGHKTTRYAKKITCPVLMQAGARDEFVLQSESERIFKAITSINKKLVMYENGRHESFLRHDTERWRSEVNEFLEANR